MLAYADGKEIEKNDEVHGWFSAEYKKGEVDFQWQDYHYRIKPEPKYRPFKDAEECWQEMRKHQPFGWVKDKDGALMLITQIEKNQNVEDGFLVWFSDSNGTAKGLFQNTTFADGTPFGAKEGEI